MKFFIRTSIGFTLRTIFPEVDEITILVCSGLLTEVIYFVWNKVKVKKKQTVLK